MQSIDIFPWDENFNTGLPKVDEQHKMLVELLNLLASHVAFRADVPQLNRIFDELANYTVYHFETEEAIWNEYLSGDESEIAHRATHQRFIDTVTRLRSEQDSKPVEQIAEEALGFLARWLASHILETDRRMAYAVLAMREGLPLAAAQARANEQMSGATRVLIDIILSIYDTLSTNTLHLMRELAERKRREAELIEAKQLAEAASIAKSRFLGNMSHELLTPLNGIMGMAQLLAANGIGEDERREFAGEILRSGTALQTVINTVLDLSSLEAGSLGLQQSAFAPAEVVQLVQARYAEAAREKGLNLAVRVDVPADENYQGDAGRLAQMLERLVDNAIKFTASGEILISVAIVAQREGASVLEFAVADTGIGIASEIQARLFEPFAQADDSNTRRFGGLGLGLAIVRRLVLLMAGELGIESDSSKGTRVWFRIPLPVEAGIN